MKQLKNEALLWIALAVILAVALFLYKTYT